MSVTGVSGYGYSQYKTASKTTSSSFSFAVDGSKEEEVKTDREVAEEKSAEEIAAFFEKMKKAGGAMKFLMNETLERIKKLLDEKEHELREKAGLNANPPLSAEARAAALKDIAKALDDYKTELLKSMTDKEKAEKEAKQNKNMIKLPI